MCFLGWGTRRRIESSRKGETERTLLQELLEPEAGPEHPLSIIFWLYKVRYALIESRQDARPTIDYSKK